MPTVNEAELLKAAAGRRDDQQLVADYAIGMIWLGWRFDQATLRLNAAAASAAAHLSSAEYLRLIRRLSLLKNLPLFPAPRTARQTLADLEREARLVVYLRSGRLAE